MQLGRLGKGIFWGLFSVFSVQPVWAWPPEFPEDANRAISQFLDPASFSALCQTSKVLRRDLRKDLAAQNRIADEVRNVLERAQLGHYLVTLTGLSELLPHFSEKQVDEL